MIRMERYKSPLNDQKSQDLCNIQGLKPLSTIFLGQAHDPTKTQALKTHVLTIMPVFFTEKKGKVVLSSASCICYMFIYANYYIPLPSRELTYHPF